MSTQPLRSFTSPSNVEKQQSLILSYQKLLKLEANMSVALVLDHPKIIQDNSIKLGKVPVFFYNLLIKDELFKVTHYILDLSSKSVTIDIENLSDFPREISINYFYSL